MYSEEFLGKSIVVVDDDIDLRNTLVSNLKEFGFKVFVAEQGLQAKDLIAQNKPDVILSDVRMPYMSGIELLRYIKGISKIPVILMTGFSDVMEAQEAFKIGAAHFLSKPFTRKELFDTLGSVLSNPPHHKGVSQTDLSFCRIPIGDFTAGSNLRVDIYLRLSDKKYIRIAKQSFELSAERLDLFKSKGLGFFYIKKEDFAKYVGVNIKVCKVVSEAENVTLQQKLHVIRHTAEILLQDTFVNGLDRNKFVTAKGVVDLVMDVMAEDWDLVLLLEMLNSNSDFLYAHSLGVSLYSALIAEEIGWESSVIKFNLSMGGLLHDIGKKEIDRFILEKSKKDLNLHELHILENHSSRGRDILSQIPSVPPDIALIALQHHENCLGRGYPDALQKEQIHPLSRLVSTANRFCELALKGPDGISLSPNDALDRIISVNKNEYDALFLEALMRIFGHPKAT